MGYMEQMESCLMTVCILLQNMQLTYTLRGLTTQTGWQRTLLNLILLTIKDLWQLCLQDLWGVMQMIQDFLLSYKDLCLYKKNIKNSLLNKYLINTCLIFWKAAAFV